MNHKGQPFSDTTSACNMFGFTEVGNYVDANLVQMLTGVNRYQLVEQFNNPSATDGAIAGTADFSPVGEAVFTGQGAGPPTGGTSFGDGRAAADAFFAGYHGSFGSDAADYVRGAEAYGPAATVQGLCFPISRLPRCLDRSLRHEDLQLPRDAVEHRSPIAVGTLPKQSNRWVPWAIGPPSHPSPVGATRQGQPDV